MKYTMKDCTVSLNGVDVTHVFKQGDIVELSEPLLAALNKENYEEIVAPEFKEKAVKKPASKKVTFE